VGLLHLCPRCRARSRERFKDGALDAEVGSGNQAEAADEAGAKIADDVAVEVFKQQRVVLEGIHDELHACVVNELLAVEDIRKPRPPCAAQRRKRPSESFMMLALWMEWIFLRPCLRAYSKANLAMRVEPFADDLDAFNDTGNYFVLQAYVFALSVFADDDEVDAANAWRGREILDGRKLAKRSNFLRSVTLMLFEAPPIGV